MTQHDVWTMSLHQNSNTNKFPRNTSLMCEQVRSGQITINTCTHPNKEPNKHTVAANVTEIWITE